MRFCPTCQENNCMKVGGVGPPRSFYLDMMGQMGYICKRCGTRGWGPGSSPGLICSCEPGDISVELDGNAWCAKRSSFINLQESIAGFGATRAAAIDDMLASEARAALSPAKETPSPPPL